ncbi:MAG: prephenate dehydratase [Bacteroidetes bacterium]|nr:prephenate dehydratase [Bacteroidota bacterium]
MIAYQGEKGSFSEQAARQFFGAHAKLKPLPVFSDVFADAEKRKGGRCIVPIENSLFGSIHQTYDLLMKHKLYIVGEIKLRIELHLMALPGARLGGIRTIYSQLQALGQCENFLGTLKNVKIEAVHDTAAAARMIRERRQHDAAAIASSQAAKAYALKILKQNVESNHRNYTRFIALSHKPVQPKGIQKTSIVFAAKNIPGSLFKSLAVFALRDINLLKIESRPLVGKPWEYLFYLDVEGTPNSDPLKQALNHLKEMCTFVRVLGSYTPFGNNSF